AACARLKAWRPCRIRRLSMQAMSPTVT
ncbi:uncharacterized protein METZ01_LOCUS177150, partial [marine metagenome]